MAEQVLTNLKVKLLEHDKPAWRVAAAIGMHPYVLSTYATGKSEIKPLHLQALCKYFNCTQADLLGTTTFDLTTVDPPLTELSDPESEMFSAALATLDANPSDTDHAAALRDVVALLPTYPEGGVPGQAKLSIVYAARRVARIAKESTPPDSGLIQLSVDLNQYAQSLGTTLTVVKP